VQEVHEVTQQELLAEQIERFISSNVNRRLSTARIAAELRYNPDYLGRVYRSSKGHSITDAIHRRKVKEARALLGDNELTVLEIADACGFRDVGYFRRVFKGLAGMTPTQFRQLYSHSHINTHYAAPHASRLLTNRS
jgi:AraC-like DNA-binding protein